jgi:hypothetical protein
MRAGFGLLAVSKLVHIDHIQCRLIPSIQDTFEAAAKETDPEYGRVAQWILFSAGAEYLLKAICLINGWLMPQSQTKLRPPAEYEDIAEWVKLANAKDPAVFVQVPYFGTLKNVPLAKLAASAPNAQSLIAGLELFRQSIRNRDAHYYAKGVRAAHFRIIPDLLVPALNAALATASSRSETQEACKLTGSQANKNA